MEQDSKRNRGKGVLDAVHKCESFPCPFSRLNILNVPSTENYRPLLMCDFKLQSRNDHWRRSEKSSTMQYSIGLPRKVTNLRNVFKPGYTKRSQRPEVDSFDSEVRVEVMWEDGGKLYHSSEDSGSLGR